jgi:hypothetical protein
MRIKNLTSDDLIIGATGQTVQAGKEAEVPDGLGRSLCEQEAVWAEAKTPPAAPSKPKADA